GHERARARGAWAGAVPRSQPLLRRRPRRRPRSRDRRAVGRRRSPARRLRGRGMRLGPTAPALLAAGALLAGCGQAGADLFVVTRSGQGPGAALTLRVSDDGFVRCNGGPRRRITDDQLLLAREIQRELDDMAKRSYPPGPTSVFRYRVRLDSGTIAFSDTSPG